MPPLPEGALHHHDAPGLHITYAGDEFLLATKLIAQRGKDAPDIITLSGRLKMENASADDLEQLIRRNYIDEDSLELILGSKDLDREVHLLAVRAERMLAIMARMFPEAGATWMVRPLSARRVSGDFSLRPAVECATDFLGKVLVRRTAGGRVAG
jgi:hypothetical protein